MKPYQSGDDGYRCGQCSTMFLWNSLSKDHPNAAKAFDDANACCRDKLPDSGARESFGQNMAVREADPTKPCLEGISPYLELALGELLRKANDKYKDHGGYRNWEKGIPVTRCIAALKRHINAFQRGDESEDHLAAIAWNAMVLIHYRDAGTTTGKSFSELDDRPRWSASK